MDAIESKWLEAVEARLGGGGGSGIDDGAKRQLLRITKVTADVTGVRYLAPLTAYLIGRAAARAEASGEALDLAGVASEIDALASSWPPA